MRTGLILQPTYRVERDRPIVQLFGRLADGAAFLVEDDRFRPYFFVRTRDVGRVARERGVAVDVQGLRDLDDAPVARVTVATPRDVPLLRDRLAAAGAPSFEADIRFAYRYLIDHGIRAAIAIEGDGEERARSESRLVVFRNPRLSPADCRPDLRVASLDIETTPDASRVFAFAIVHGGGEEAHLVSSRPVAGAESHPDEVRLLAALGERIRALDPDIVLGWNVVDFDLRVVARRCADLGIPCHLGRLAFDVRFEQDRTFTRQGRADVAGRMVLDAASLVRDALRLEDYRLDTAARAILGRGKLLDTDVPDAALEINRLFREDPEALVAYNLEDARLAREIVDREGLLDLTIERSLLTGMQLDRVGASIASFDLVYLPELRRRGVVAPNVDMDRPSELVQGGAVLDSVPGLFRNVAVFDFKSLYPSLIRTFQLDPLAHARARRPDVDAIEAPNGARFARDAAILPGVIDRFMASREAAKARGDRHADQAIKIMMNALFGVLGSPACRFFDAAVANAITGFGQQILAWTREALEDEGFAVVYGDTDSVFVKLSREEPGEAARAEAEALRERVERRIVERVRERYRVEPKLTLELEHVLERFFMPRVRSGVGGSKKRYAGWVDGGLVVVGLESVRRDWPAIARRLQEGILVRLFGEEDPMPFVGETVAALRRGELDRELVYAKRIRKGSVDRYTAAIPPHVQAARKAGAAAGPVIRYVMTIEGPEPVLPGRPLPAGIDREHYVERVLRPVADAILPEIGREFDEATGAPRQLRLW
ncbi:MAG TPA: DNA polymerase II [Candidatus Binatia bacterium]|nr:DNA polymerase II [Candidatus Binatia bacterium]